VVNLDPRQVQTEHVELDLGAFGLDPGTACGMHDLLTGGK